MKGREYGMSTKTEKELEQKYLDNVIDKVKQAEQKAEKRLKRRNMILRASISKLMIFT